jgi:hypothetical protein
VRPVARRSLGLTALRAAANNAGCRGQRNSPAGCKRGHTQGRGRTKCQRATNHSKEPARRRCDVRTSHGVHWLRDTRRRCPAGLEGAAAARDSDRVQWQSRGRNEVVSASFALYLVPQLGPTKRKWLMMNPGDDDRRALDVLARHSDGCDEAVLLADGFTIRLLAGW